MKLFCAAVVLLLFSSTPLLAQHPAGGNYEDIPKTRWVSPSGERPGTYAEYLARTGPPRPFQTERVQGLNTTSVDSGRPFLILVNSAYYIFTQDEIAVYVDDIAAEGFSAEVHTTIGGQPQDLRNFLITEYYEKYGSAFAGVLFVGDLPVAWYDLSGDQFPTDLYYMDMDGDYFDDNGDGMFDRHEDGIGDTAPEIFLGRMVLTPLSGPAYETAEKYFDKIHAYRMGNYTVPEGVLGFCDDDWAHWGYYGLDWGFDDVTIIDGYDDTNAGHYKQKLDAGFHFMHTMAHSYSGGHHFADSSGGGWCFNWEVENIDPWALFYNLFACSNCRYTDTDYMGGVYIFCESYGLAAVGSTKSGSMLGFEHFYEPMHRNMTIGDAYREWWESRYPYGPGDQSWFYGMTLLGDPLLVPRAGFYNDPPSASSGFAQYPPLQPASPEQGSRFGGALAFGDVNDDGHADLVAGAPLSGPGEVVVFFGPDFSKTQEIFAEFPELGESFGYSLACADVNKDGIDDIAVGIPGRDASSSEDAGAVRVIYGPSLSYGPQVVHSYPKTQVRFGSSLAIADFNKDGEIDLAVGGPGGYEGGIAEVFKGPGFTSLIHYDPTTFGIMGRFGASLASGDLNGDGCRDLIIGAPKAGQHGDFIAFLGPSLTFPMNPKGYTMGGLSRFGSAIVADDFDGDGKDDLAVGAPGTYSSGLHGAGEVALFKGPNLIHFMTLNAPAPEKYAEFGYALAAEDFNGDGHPDLAVGAPFADHAETRDVGRVYLFYGPDFTKVRELEDSQPKKNSGFGEVVAAGDFMHGLPGLAAAAPIAGDVHRFGFCLTADEETIDSQTGGSVTFDLYAGSDRANRTYVTALSASGTVPGTMYGGVAIPLNLDALTNLGFLYMNTTFFQNFGGVLDKEGRAQSVFFLPPGITGIAGMRLYFTFFTLSPVDFAANPVAVDIE